jgi:two-component system sensor histidine kinase UhpB
MLQDILKRLKRTPIFYRIAIGNASIIIIGAIVAIILTRILTSLTATLWHYVLFASIGILISLVVNILILNAALQPLYELRHTINRLQIGQDSNKQVTFTDTDPDIYRLTKTLNSLITQLETSNQQLRTLTERAINAQEDERKRIARSLHDDTGQSLSSLIINLERLEQHPPADQQALAERLNSSRKIASKCLDGLRGIIYDLRPAILDDLGLIPAIRWYARTNLEEAGIHVQLEFPDELLSLPQPLTTTLFRITQEGVNNIVRHSQAKKASISLNVQGGEVQLNLKDDGHGFDPDQIDQEALHEQHWGLIGIQERVELVRGRMSITSDPQHGTTLLVCLPLHNPEGEQNG